MHQAGDVTQFDSFWEAQVILSRSRFVTKLRREYRKADMNGCYKVDSEAAAICGKC